MTKTYLILATLGLAGCSGDVPELVFVPGPSYSESLDVRTEQGDSARVAVGSPLILHGRRTSGPWMQVSSSSLAPGACWMASPPDRVEDEVAGNLRWTAYPAEAEFNTDLRLDQTRVVRFSRPGAYFLTAQSHGWCSAPYFGDTLWIQVTSR